MKNLCLLMCLLLASFIATAQSDGNLLVETNTTESLNLCGEPQELAITITNSSNKTATTIQFESNLPDGVTLVNSDYMNIGTLDIPMFNIPDIQPNTSIDFTYSIAVSCDFLVAYENTLADETEFNINNENTINYSLNNQGNHSFTGDSESYNIRFADLEVKVADDDVNLFTGILEKDADGTVFNREVEVRNSGLGQLSEYTFYVDADSPLDFTELKLGGQALVPNAIGISPNNPNATRYTYVFTDFTTIGNGNAFFEQGEVMTFTDTVSMHFGDCESALQTNYTVNWGCNGQICNEDDQEATSVAFISFVEGLPNINNVITQQFESGDFCGDTLQAQYQVINSGNGSETIGADAAFNVYVRLSKYSHVNPNFSINNTTLIDETPNNTFYYLFSFDNNPNFTVDVDGPGGLEDLDQDGYFDDLPVGNSFFIDIEMDASWQQYLETETTLRLAYLTTFYNNNECELPTYSKNSYYMMARMLYFSTPSLQIPEEMGMDQLETFYFSVDRENVLQYPVGILNFGDFVSEFFLPEGYIINEIRWIPKNGNPEILVVQDLGNNHYRVIGGSERGTYEMDVSASCTDGAPEIGKVDWIMFLDACPDPDYDEKWIMADLSQPIFTNYEACDPNNNEDGICHFATDNFSINRNTFGYVMPQGDYYTHGEIVNAPKVDKNTPGLKLDAVYPTDEVLVEAEGRILQTDVTETYNTLYFEFAFYLPEGFNGELLTHIEEGQQGTISIDGNSLALPAPQVNIDQDNRITYTYVVPYNFDTSIEKNIIVSNLSLKTIERSGIDLYKGSYPLSVFRGNFYGKQINEDLGCSTGTKGGALSLLVPENIYTLAYSPNITCNNSFYEFFIRFYSATNTDDFPNEYRPIAFLESYISTPPKGYTYDTAASFAYVGNIINPNVPFSSSNDAETNEFEFLVDDIPILEAKNQNNYIYFKQKLVPVCDEDFVIPDYYNYTPMPKEIWYKDLLDNIPSESKSNSNSRFYTNPPITISPNAIQEGYERSVSWPVVYCHEGITFNIQYPWIALELKDNDTRTVLQGATDQQGNELEVIFYGGETPETARGMLVKVGSLSAGTCRTVYPRVTYTDCENDAVQNIELFASKECEAYPLEDLNIQELAAIGSITDPGALSCQFTLVEYEQELTLKYKTGDLAWEVTRLEDNIDLCEPLTYQVEILSSKFANVYETELTVTLPQGVSVEDINNIQYEFDGQLGVVDYVNFIDDDIQNTGEFIIKASELVTAILVDQGIPGINPGDNTIPGSRLPGKDKITFDINLIGDCTMDPGLPIRFDLDGVTNCNDNINLYFNRLHPVNGIDLPELDVDISASNFLVCNTQNQVDINLINNDPDNISNQELQLTLPEGTAYGGVLNGTPEPIENGNVLTWNIDDINVDKNQSFSINTILTNFNILSFDYVAEIFQEGEGLCAENLQSCQLEVTTAQNTDNAVQLTLPDVVLVPLNNFPICEGTPIIVEVQMEGIEDFSDFQFDWNVPPQLQNNNQFTFLPENSVQLEVNVYPVGSNNEDCGGSAQLDVEVYPGANISIVLLEGVTCPGQSDASVNLSITGEANTGYTEQEPFEIINISPGANNLLAQFMYSGEVKLLQNLPSGPFTVEFRDNYGCTFERTVNIPVISNPISNLCTTLLPCGVAEGDVELSFSTLDIHSVLNGNPYVAKVVDNQQETTILEFGGGFPDNQSLVLENVSTVGNYTLEITAQNGCVYTHNFSIDSYQVSASVSNDQDPGFYELCFANETRDVAVNISDNMPVCSNFTLIDYKVTFGEVDSENNFEGIPQVFANINNEIVFEDLGVGNYKVVVVPSGINGYEGDIELCETELTFSLTSKASFNASLDITDPLCAGEANGSAKVIINGGLGNFAYEWKVQGGNEVISVGQQVTGLSAGNYEVVVTDTNGCPNAIPLTFTLTDPEPLEVPFVEDVQVACEAIAGSKSGSKAIGYTSGTSPYLFKWYEVITTTDYEDSEIKTESFVYQEIVQENGVSVFNGITPGDYKVVVTDANGCTAESLVTQITQPVVERQYNINLSWKTKAIEEKQGAGPLNFNAAPIAASSYRRALMAKVERCISETQEVSMESVANLLKDVELLRDTLSLAYINSSDVYHHTLYYYDRAGNLVRTVPPAGVRVAKNGDNIIDRVPTQHTYVTGYDYNSIAQLDMQNTPDGGTTNFLYNDLGQLLYSQNQKQKTEDTFSYSIYDDLGRIIEAGEAELKGKIFPDDLLDEGQADENVAINLLDSEKIEYIRTIFNKKANIAYMGNQQEYLRNRVSYIYNLDKNGDESYTYYSYDPHGNVEWIVQELPTVGRTTVAYKYDLVSGNVNQVTFNLGRVGEYHHKYTYDADNRIVVVKTSKDGHLWDEDARYDYYLHGPLARTSLGEDRVQGLDFTYTIHGWLKAINTPDLAQNSFNPDSTNNLGDDPKTHSKDEFGMALGYYSGDFSRQGILDSRLMANNPFVLENQIDNEPQNLYNGNISTWVSQTAKEAKDKDESSYIVGNAYRYDQLNRIKQATAKVFDEVNQTYVPIKGNSKAYNTTYAYDGNGNLRTLKRYAENGLMDDLIYYYDYTDPNLSNKLTHVDDGAGQLSQEINDLPDQQVDNYYYNAAGQLVSDVSEGLRYFWNTSGKVSQVLPKASEDPNSQKVHLIFTYDGLDNRIVKKVNRQPYQNGIGPRIYNPEAMEVTYYHRDAQGNVMAVYQRTDTKIYPGNPDDISYKAVFRVIERPIYGSDRIGQDVNQQEVYSTEYDFKSELDYNKVSMEFQDSIIETALGNVLVAQNIEEEFLDGENQIIVPGTRLLTATVEGEYGNLEYVAMPARNANGVPITTDNNIFLIEDKYEQPWGYGVVGSNYYDNEPDQGEMLIYNTQGELIPGLELINTVPLDYYAKSVVVKKTNSKEYYLFYKDTAGDLHAATLSTGQGSLKVVGQSTMGFSNYGRHMAVVEDHKTGFSYVFATQHTDALLDDNDIEVTPPQATMVRFTITPEGNIVEDGTVLNAFTSYDTKGNGELQIALDGGSISMYNYTGPAKQPSGMALAEIRSWPFTADWEPIQDNVKKWAIAGNIGKGSLIHTGEEIFYTQHAQNNGVDKYSIIRATDNTLVSSQIGDLRTNKNHKLFNFVKNSDSGLEFSLLGTNIELLNNLPSSIGGATGYQPYQPYVIKGTVPPPTSGVVYRNIGEKQYELKDHLGNVRVVVGDRKNLNTETNELSAHVVAYNNYYPFGMPQPGRNFDSQEYRYGFQGQEGDPEIKGSGNSWNFKYRMHDPRVGRWLSVDPMAHLREWVSPYNFVQNNPILRVDPTGALDGEYEITHDKDGNEVKTKVSDLGDDVGIDFNHHLDGENAGKTEIVNTNNGVTNWISDSRFMRGYTQRGDETNWNSIYQEWKNGTGPENSLFFGRDHPMIQDIRKSNLYHGARNTYLEKKAWDFDNKIQKAYIPIDFGLSGLLLSGTNMTMQMMGSGGASFYDIGNNQRLTIITDSKTRESFYYHLPWINNYERGSKTYNIPGTWIYDDRETNTNQTYIWIDNNVEN